MNKKILISLLIFTLLLCTAILSPLDKWLNFKIDQLENAVWTVEQYKIDNKLLTIHSTPVDIPYNKKLTLSGTIIIQKNHESIQNDIIDLPLTIDLYGGSEFDLPENDINLTYEQAKAGVTLEKTFELTTKPTNLFLRVFHYFPKHQIFVKIKLYSKSNPPLLHSKYIKIIAISIFTVLLLYFTSRTSKIKRCVNKIKIKVYQNKKFYLSVGLMLIIILAIGIYSMFLGEKIPIRNGLGWDGVRYANMVKHFHQMVFVDKLNSYYLQRMFPSGVVHFTDTTALVLGTMLLFFALRNSWLGMLVTLIVCNFTWPAFVYPGLILFVFPLKKEQTKEPTFGFNYIIASAISIILLAFIIYYRFINKTVFPFDPIFTIDNLVFVSIPLIGLYLFFAIKILFNRNCINDIKNIFKVINIKHLFLAVIIFVPLHFLIINYSKGESTNTITGYFHNITLASIAAPLTSLVSHIIYFGPIIILCILYWKKCCSIINSYGIGFVLFIFLSIIQGIDNESRRLIAFFPFYIAVCAKVVSSMKFSNSFYLIFALISFLFSRFWLPINVSFDNNEFWKLIKGVPNLFGMQLYFMNHGPYMGVTYWIQLLLVLLTGLFFYYIIRHCILKKHDHTKLLFFFSASIIVSFLWTIIPERGIDFYNTPKNTNANNLIIVNTNSTPIKIVAGSCIKKSFPLFPNTLYELSITAWGNKSSNKILFNCTHKGWIKQKKANQYNFITK